MNLRARTVERRQAILDASLELFASQGFQSTSMDDICSASGASNGSVYHHFGSKEGIAAALYADAIADYQRDALEVITAAPSTEAGFRGCIEHYLAWVRDHRALAMLMLAVEHGDVRAIASDAVARLNHDFSAGVDEWMRSRAEAGDLPDVPRDVLLPALLGPARRFAELWLAGRTTTAIEDAARSLSDLAWRGFAGAARAGTTSSRRNRGR